MTGTVQHDDRDVAHGLFAGFRDAADIFRHRGFDVDDVFRLGTDDQFVHVKNGLGIEHRAARRAGDDADRAADAERRQTRPVDGVHRDVHFGVLAGAEVFAVEQHRRFIFFTFSDHHNAIHVNGIEHVTHCVDGRAVGGIFVAAPHQTPGRHRGGFRAAAELKR